MKTPLLKLLLGLILIVISVHSTEAACTASFTRSISGMTVTFTNTSTTTSGFPNMMMYYWTFGDGTHSYDKNPTKTYATAGTKIVQLTTNDSFGCVKTVVDTIILTSAAPTCNASFTRSVSGLSVTFTNTSTSSAGLANVHYSWYFSDGLSSTLTNPTVTFPTAGMKVAQLTLYDSSTACSSTYMDSIPVTTPTSSCAAKFTKSATGNTVVLTNTSTNTSGLATGLSYNWSFSDGTSSTLKDPTKVFATNGLKTITLTITDSSQGCFATKVDSVVLPSACAASYTKSISGLTVTFTNTSLNVNGTSSGLSYEWHFSDDGTTYTSKNLTKTFPTAGYKAVRLTINDPVQGCSAKVHDTIFLSPSSCAANFTKSISGLSVSLTNTSLNTNGSSTGLSYYWTYSDGTSSTQKNQSKMFTTGGYKTITLTISDSVSGCFSSKTDTVFLIQPCAASFLMSASGLTINLVNLSTTTSSLKYHWAFSDGTTSDLKNPSKTFATPGLKTISLSISDSLTGCFSNYTDTITLVSVSPSLCAASFTKTISGLTVNLTNTSLNSNGTATGLKYLWHFSDGTTSDTKNPVKTFATAGIKIINLTISDSTQNCQASTVDTITVASNTCNASFTFAQTGALTVKFTSTSTNMNGTDAGLHYSWTFSDGTSATTASLFKTFATPGVKWAQLTISDSTTGCFASHIDSFMLSSACAAHFTATVSGQVVTFTNTSSNTNGTTTGLKYLWHFGDGTTSDTKNPLHTYASSGVKLVTLSISDSIQGCYSTISDTVVIAPTTPCAASFAKSISGLTVSFINTSVNVNGSTTGLKYSWLFGDGTTSDMKNPVHTYASGGVKVITLFISDTSKGCSSSFTDTIFLSPPCLAHFSLAIDTTTPFHFFILNTSIIRTTSTFHWDFGDGTTSNLMIPTHSYANFGMYYVCLTVSDTFCTSTFCDSIGMDSNGILLKQGAFGFETLDFTTVATETGTKEITSATEYCIYPNPSNGDVYVDYDATTAAPLTIRVADITGKVVKTKSVSGQRGKHTETIDISDLQPAIYFMTIESEGRQKNYKLIKN
jgi:PKD repeat protein